MFAGNYDSYSDYVSKHKEFFPDVYDDTPDTINITDNISGEVFEDVEVVSEDDLPRGCESIAWATDQESCIRYEIYKDCITKMLYAIEDTE